MAEPARRARMSADEFFAWAAEEAVGRFELSRGEVVAVSPEGLAHVRAKRRAANALDAAAAAAGLPCEAFADGVAVRVDDVTLYEPDASLRCGATAPDEAVFISDPVVLVEVVSRSTRSLDSGVKLSDYFRLPSVSHYLIINPEARMVIHHSRGGGDEIMARILRGGTLRLDPPGLELPLEALFGG